MGSTGTVIAPFIGLAVDVNRFEEIIIHAFCLSIDGFPARLCCSCGF